MDWRDLLVLPTFIVSLFAFLISAWTAVQLGRIDFERRRQDLLTRAYSFQVLIDERADAWDRLVSRIDALDPIGVDSHLREKWARLRGRLEATKDALKTRIPDRAKYLTAIKNMRNGLLNRSKLESAIGEEDRILAGFSMRGWDAELAEDRDHVASLEEAFAAAR